MRIPDGFLREIKFRNNIQDIISGYIALKRNGSNLTGLCPFHNEKTPSFTVFDQNGSFYCFGCGAGGDVITFAMMIENLDYISALTKLAESAGIPMPSGEENAPVQLIKSKRLFELNRAAALYFHRNLTSEKGKTALEYLYGRGLSGAVIKRFGLGYACDSWNDLTDAMTAEGFEKNELKTAFLAGISKNGNYFDYFKNRVIFPILDVSSNVIAFGGRSMDDTPPKYLNSSDTDVFKKSRNLYALNFAKKSRSDYFILCEGYMDTIAMHQAGFSNAVASLGTAFTADQSRLISRYVKKVLIAYDSDEAGIKASEKAASHLGSAGVEVKILSLSGAKDPDEFIKRFGKEKFQDTISTSKSYIDHNLDLISKKYDIDNAGEKIKAVTEACALISSSASLIEQEVYGEKTAELYGISAAVVLNELKRLNKLKYTKQKKELFKQSEEILAAYGDKINPDAARNPRAAKAEEEFLGMLLNHPDNYEYVKELITPDMFVTEFGGRIFKLFFEAADDLNDISDFDIALILKDLTTDESGRVIKMITPHHSGTDSSNKDILDQLITIIKDESIKKNISPSGTLSAEEWERQIRTIKK